MYGRGRGCKAGIYQYQTEKAFVADYLNQMEEAEDLGIQKAENLR